MPSHDLDELVAEIRAMLDSDDAASNISEPPSSVHEAAIDAVVAEIRAALQGDESDMMSDDESVIEPVDPPMTLKSKRAAKAFAAQAPLRAMEREIQSTDAFLGEDPLGRTNTALVSECRTKFKAWSQAQRSVTPPDLTVPDHRSALRQICEPGRHHQAVECLTRPVSVWAPHMACMGRSMGLAIRGREEQKSPWLSMLAAHQPHPPTP